MNYFGCPPPPPPHIKGPFLQDDVRSQAGCGDSAGFWEESPPNLHVYFVDPTAQSVSGYNDKGKEYYD